MRLRALFFLVMPLAGTWLLSTSTADGLHGQVVDEHGAVPSARIRFQGQKRAVVSDAAGRFRIGQPQPNRRPLTAWKAGYRIEAAQPDRSPIRITMTRLPAHDNEDYSWLDPHPDPAQAHNCGNCHGEIFREWRGSGHARAATNPRFLEMIDGRNPHGDIFPSWNLSREHPLGVGVCATCHVPTHFGSEPRKVSSVAVHGVHCDYCHKIVEAPTDKLGTRFGRDGLTLLRPANGEALFFGPLDDAVRKGESFGHLPLYKESRYCASCHEGTIFGVPVYSTYSEWLESPARKRGEQCQTCHMAPTGKMTNIAPGHGGIERRPETLASHHFPGGQAEMLRRSLTLTARGFRHAHRVHVHIQIRANQVGHCVPTGFIDRNLVLVVEARDRNGNRAAQLDGQKLSQHAGKNLTGLPGTIFAKRLIAPDGTSPIPFWLPHEKLVDTRLEPERTQSFEFVFAAEAMTIQVRLVYRRFWPALAEPRGWADNEIVVVEQEFDVAR